MTDRDEGAARREALRRLAMASAIGSGGMTMLLRAALAASTQTGMRSIRGSVTIDGRPATQGQEIRPSQKVVTGPGSEAIYVIGQDAFLQHENSAFGIDESTGVAVLRYITGKVLSVFGKGRKRLDTPTATIGIRGTGCFIEAGEDNTYFCLCYGSAIVEPKGNPSARRRLQTEHHESPLYVSSGKKGPAYRAAKVIDHTDAELIMLEKLVGRLPPFYGKDYTPY